ncbi:hypothetical protein GCM10023340_28270 [Nocardioides marinquilinus]|uniref:Uncharacterized protein n=1 Tax=Nocardioides marinquilinus TaxID=1210400 RepID=A0ABP9PS04_9ACTN
MGWRELAKQATTWAEARRTELVTTDRTTREDAEVRAEDAERAAREEAATSAFERVLPTSLADRVTAARPENVEARRAAAEAADEQRRRERLADLAAAGETAELRLGLTGGEEASVVLTLPCEAEEDHDDPALPWLRVRVEAPDPVPVGSTALTTLALAVPGYTGWGRYDLAEQHRRGEVGEIGWWEPFDLHLAPRPEEGEDTWYVDLGATPPPVVEVHERSVDFDLPMASALGSLRATGSVAW